MPNQAYLFIEAPTPTADRVFREILRVVCDLIPKPHLTYQINEQRWILCLGHDARMAIDYGTASPISQSSEEVSAPVQPCIVFPHGHSYGIFYWIEREIRLHLLETFGGFVEDDNYGGLIEEEPIHHQNYAEYLQWRYKRDLAHNPKYYTALYQEDLDNHQQWFPHLAHLIGTLPSISSLQQKKK